MTKLELAVADMRGRIDSGEWRTDERLPSRFDLAKRLDVSPTTISNAIRELEKEGLVYAVSSKGVYVAQREHGAPARGYTIGVKTANANRVALEGMRSPLFGSLWAAADACGSHILLMTSDPPPKQRRASNPDGIIFIGGEGHDEARRLRATGFPVITINQPSGPTSLNYVDLDNTAALREIVRRFAELGHRRIAVLSGETTVPDYYQQKKAHFLEALSKYGLLGDYRDEYWCLYRHDHANADPFRLARVEIKALLDHPAPPTAVFTWTPTVASYLLEEAAARGMKIPRDLSVASTRVDTVTQVALSGFIPPFQELATVLLQEMIATIENPFHHVQRLIPLSYTEGATLGPASPQS